MRSMKTDSPPPGDLTVLQLLERERLGPVDKPAPETKASEQDEAEEAGCGLVIPGSNTPLFLEMTNEALGLAPVSRRVGSLRSVYLN